MHYSLQKSKKTDNQTLTRYGGNMTKKPKMKASADPKKAVAKKPQVKPKPVEPPKKQMSHLQFATLCDLVTRGSEQKLEEIWEMYAEIPQVYDQMEIDLFMDTDELLWELCAKFGFDEPLRLEDFDLDYNDKLWEMANASELYEIPKKVPYEGPLLIAKA